MRLISFARVIKSQDVKYTLFQCLYKRQAKKYEFRSPVIYSQIYSQGQRVNTTTTTRTFSRLSQTRLAQRRRVVSPVNARQQLIKLAKIEHKHYIHLRYMISSLNPPQQI